MSDFNNKKHKQFNFGGYVKPIKIYCNIKAFEELRYDERGNLIKVPIKPIKSV
jgi:hypothetical protein